jgi:toxin ParE1/3/4
MPIKFSNRAKQDLASISKYIAKDSKTNAINLVKKLVQSVTLQLEMYPNSGRPGRVAGTREFVAHHSYIVAYRVEKDQVLVLTFRHASRLWPEIM